MIFFIWNDYLKLNKDLSHIKTKEEAKNHWTNIGIKQMRLCNKLQLEVKNEFGNEIACYIPYYYYLYSNNLLFDNKITTYKGMKPFYYFLDTNKHIIEKDDKRYWVDYCNRPFLVNNNEHVSNFDDNFNIEWSDKPYNFFNLESLDKIFSTLSDKYQIIYIRPTNNISSNFCYSYDENNIIEELQDYELIENKYKNKVITFNSILEKYKDYSYNKTLLKLYSNCENYICIQGGSAYLISYFLKNMLLLHIRGDEIQNNNNNCYTGWLLKMNDEPNKVLTVCRDNNDIPNKLTMFT